MSGRSHEPEFYKPMSLPIDFSHLPHVPVHTPMTTAIHPPTSHPWQTQGGLKIHPRPVHPLVHQHSSSVYEMPRPSAESSRKRSRPSVNDEMSAESMSNLSADSLPDEEDEEYNPPRNTQPKRNAKGKGKSGRTVSREALRKANHSLIEKRRREKINSALADLRDMVPGLGDTGGGGKANEFKLEVLERTVTHMRELKTHIRELEAELKRRKSPTQAKRGESTISLPPPGPGSESKPSESPPTPSASANASPALHSHAEVIALGPPSLPASASRSPEHSRRTPSISALLASSSSSNSSNAESSRQTQSRNQPSPSTAPSIYLPFPTPSPTSPFLNYDPTQPTNKPSGRFGLPDPSPFLAPIQNMSLFGGALNLDPPAKPEDTDNMPVTVDKGVEEAANVLLAFSSPDTMRPVGGNGPGNGNGNGKFHNGDGNGNPTRRRNTLDTDDFVLDSAETAPPTIAGRGRGDVEMHVGKTARDILQM